MGCGAHESGSRSPSLILHTAQGGSRVRLVYSWIVIGTVFGVIAHYILGKERGYDMFGEILVGICAGASSGTIAPIVLGVRTGSVDILSDVGLLCSALGSLAALGALVYFTPRVAAP